MGIIREQVPTRVRRYVRDGDKSVYDLHRHGFYIATLRPVESKSSPGTGINLSELSATVIDFLEEEPGNQVLLKYQGKVVAKLRNEVEE